MSDTKRRLLGVLAVVALALPFAGCGDDAMAPAQIFDNPSTIRVVNNLGGPVLFFRIRTCGTTAYSEDLLPLDPIAGTIQPGDSKEFTVEAGCYDLWAQHLATTDPGPLVDKFVFDQVASPITPLVWVLDPITGGPS